MFRGNYFSMSMPLQMAIMLKTAVTVIKIAAKE